MFKNYLKITWRNIVRQRANSFINIVGLATGMTACILILMWVQHELSFDKFHENADDIYRVVENQYYAGGEIFPVAVTPSALAPALKEQFPEIIKTTRFSFRGSIIKYGDKIFDELGGFADPDFLKIFTFPFIKGDPETALSDPHAIVLTEEIAEKYFGNDDPIGKTLRINNRDDFKVSGVIKNIPVNSHLEFDFLAPFVYLEELGRSMDDWGSNSYYTYVLLRKGTPYQQVNDKIIDLIKKNSEGSVTEIYLQPLTKIHLNSAGKYTADIRGHGDIQYVKTFSMIAIFVLLIACINFMNLATARSEKRAKEVGLRKVVGAQRNQLILQFLSESIFMVLLAFVIALVATEVLLPTFNDLSGKNLALNQLGLDVILGFVGIAVVTGIISGSYPALYLSSFQPVQTLKGSRRARSGNPLFRKVLVVVQFTLSVIMIIGTLVVSRQIDYIRNKKLGLEKENLAYVRMSGEFEEKYEAAKQELLKNPNITNVTVTSQLPTYVAQSTSGWEWEGKNPEDTILMHFISVGYDYAKTFKMGMVKGRFFAPEFGRDSVAAVVNETAAEIMNMESPVGKRLAFRSTDLRIIGVIKDFHFKPIRTKIEPLILIMDPDRFNVMVIRTRPENILATVEYIKTVYKTFNAETPFSLSFLDERYDALYRSEQRVEKVLRYFAVIAILISCLGLFGLVSYTAEQRTKEIGIRKVLGATVANVMTLLSQDFLKLVLVANLLAWPVAFYAMKKWLQNFAYRIEIGWWVFALAGGLAMVIALLTVSTQAIKAALANPVQSLRYE